MPVRPLVPPAQRGRAGGVSRWDEDEVARMVARCESFGLAAAVANLGISGDMLLGLPGREGDAEIVCDNIRTAGRAGLRCLTWNFTALRSSEGYGASAVHDHDSQADDALEAVKEENTAVFKAPPSRAAPTCGLECSLEGVGSCLQFCC